MPAADHRAYPVLCVDDEESNLILMRYALEPQFDVLTTSDPAEAAEILSSGRVAVLLTDQRMPGMSGVELCAHARAVAPDTVRVIITGYADLHATIDAVNRGAVMRYLEKPLREGELAEVVRSAINVVHAKRAIVALERQIIQGGTAQAFRTIERRVARELRGPVGELLGASSHLQDLATGLADQKANAALVSELAQTVAEVQEHVRTLQRMTDRLDRSTSAAGRTDVHRVVRSILSLSGTHPPSAEKKPLEVEIDRSVLAQALGAAFRRALKVAQSPDSVRLECQREGRHVVCEVIDDGAAPGSKELAAIFDARLNPLPGDDGRSMALAAELVRHAGGEVSARRDGPHTIIAFKLSAGDER